MGKKKGIPKRVGVVYKGKGWRKRSSPPAKEQGQGNEQSPVEGDEETE